MKKGISVIVCCFNSSSRLRETLKHLSLQRVHELEWEIVLVDNASTDNTKEVGTKLWKEFGPPTVTLTIVEESIQGLSFARAKGVASSNFDILVFCDDDNWLDQNYLQIAFQTMEDNAQAGALGGTGTAVADIPLPAWFEQYKGCYACYRQSESDGELTGTFSFLYGAGMIVRREVLDLLSDKNFMPILPDRIGATLTSGGDTELSYAIRLAGYKLWFSDKLRFLHYLPSPRLTEAYLYRLISSMSYCSGILILYNYVITGKEVNRLVWLKDATYQVYFLVKSLHRYPMSKESSLDKRLNFAFSYNRMRSVFHQIGKYRSRYKQVTKLKT